MSLSDNAGRILAALVRSECGDVDKPTDLLNYLVEHGHDLAKLAVELAEALETPLLAVYARGHESQSRPEGSDGP